MKLPAHPVKTGQARQGLPGNVDVITRSALTPLRESVAALPAPAYRQEAGHPADLPVTWHEVPVLFPFFFKKGRLEINPIFTLAHYVDIFNLKFISPAICIGLIWLTEGAFLS